MRTGVPILETCKISDEPQLLLSDTTTENSPKRGAHVDEVLEVDTLSNGHASVLVDTSCHQHIARVINIPHVICHSNERSRTA